VFLNNRNEVLELVELHELLTQKGDERTRIRRSAECPPRTAI
jgi:hypothetical protein